MALAAEALLAVTGLFPTDPLGPAEGRDAKALPKQWKAAIDAFLDAATPTKFDMPPHVDWEKTWAKLSAGIDQEQIATVTASLVDDAIDQDFKVTLSNAWEYVRSRWPVYQMDTVSKRAPTLLPPGRVELGKAETLLATLDDPSRIVDEMRSHTLTYDQAAALKGVYPALYDMLKAILDEALDRREGAKKDFTVGHAKETVIRKLWGVPPGVELSRVEPPAAKPGESAPNIKIDFSRQETKAQSLQDTRPAD